jgi:hypothetical protein
MKKILFAASFWDDDFIYSLSPTTKLFYIFLITNRNVTPSGFYKLGKIDKMKAGLTPGQVKTALEDLKNKVFIISEYVFIKNLLHKSFLENTTEEKFKKSNIYKMIVEQITNNSTPPQLIELFKQTYPIFIPCKPLVSPLHTPSIPLPNTDTNTNIDIDTDNKYMLKGFDETLLTLILNSIKTQIKSKQWQEGIIPLPATWLNGERWTDEYITKPQRDESHLDHIPED